MFSGLVEPKLSVGASVAPVGLCVMAAVNVTLPVNPPAGVTVIVEAFPVVTPGASETFVPPTANDGFTGVFTTSVTESVAVV
jgi:hypothetical protein